MSDTQNLYLIAHKVRGQLAFDVAHELQIGSEVGWIIPTSGHRAYPIAYYPLSQLHIFFGANTMTPPQILQGVDLTFLRDHYHRDEPERRPAPPTRRAPAPRPTLEDLL